MLKVGQRLAGRWDKAAATGQPVDLQADLMRFTVDTIAGLAFGTEVNTLESDDDIIQKHLDKIFPAMFERLLAPFPIWRYFKRKKDRELEHSMAEVNAAVATFIAKARARVPELPATGQADPELARLFEALKARAVEDRPVEVPAE